MKTLVVYTSQTGFTKKYAGWLAEKTGGDVFDVKDVQKKPDSFFADYDAIVYAGWVMAGKVVKANWLFGKASSFADKRLAVVAVGGCPNEAPEVQEALKTIVPDELKATIPAFYCQGGFNYAKMNTASRMALKMFIGMLKSRKNQTEDQKRMVELISHDYDIADPNLLEPVIKYIEG
ncbi:MAG: flavodoxin [Lachnospiraceae bacterium]|nr:flavodoxin [Lachnospiraceae bacterium]